MTVVCNRAQLVFHGLTVGDRDSVQAVTLAAGRRNCNFTFANLIGWQFWFNTEVCILDGVVVFRFNMEGARAYMLCAAEPPTASLLGLLAEDAAQLGADLRLMGLEDDHAACVQEWCPQAVVEPQRNRYDYVYLRHELATMQGKNLKAKRNHVNKFRLEHPEFEYVDLTPARFGECRQLSMLWRNEVHHDSADYGEMVLAEQRKVRMQYLSNQRYRIVESENSKLLVDDEVEILSFVLHHPLLVLNVWRNGESLGQFTAGRVSGLSSIKIV